MSPDLAQREVGWLVTADPPGEEDDRPSGRIGYGQLLGHARETTASFNGVIGRSVFVDTSLTEHMIPEDKKVRWLSFSDDMDPGYAGVVNVEWLLGAPAGLDDEDDDPAYNIDRFCETDRGDVIVLYNAEDIKRCAAALSSNDARRERWTRFAENHPRLSADRRQAMQGCLEYEETMEWLPIYG